LPAPAPKAAKAATMRDASKLNLSDLLQSPKTSPAKKTSPALTPVKALEDSMAPAPQATAPEPPPPLTPLPEGAPENAEAAELLENARRVLRDRHPEKALPLLEQAGERDPKHTGIQRLLLQTRIEVRKQEIEAMTSQALNYFVDNKYAKARKAVDQALALDPNNKKAKELLKILSALT
jgi:tetratricopeptide (TPR) repeat protein